MTLWPCVQAVAIIEAVLEKFGTYENFEAATGGQLLTKCQIWSIVRKYMQKEGCVGEVSLPSLQGPSSGCPKSGHLAHRPSPHVWPALTPQTDPCPSPREVKAGFQGWVSEPASSLAGWERWVPVCCTLAVRACEPWLRALLPCRSWCS